MNKAITMRAKKLLPGLLRIKRILYRRLEEQLRSLEEQGASLKVKKRLRVKLRGYRNEINALEKVCGRGDPPVFGELLLLLLLPEKNSEYQLGDVAEKYRKLEAKKGSKVATLNYYGEVIREAWPRIRKVLWWVILVWLSHQI